MQFNIEMTDTFGGEANYSWVKRATIDAPENTKTSTLIRRAKAALNIGGRHRTSDYGDAIRLDLSGSCVCVFITPAI